ncbi:MAG: hypothetical protein K2P81_15225 [Bacteriovoracaceae bacterium]|nr:hypothetical protein [Bacteriovoracaceae bacterium]
MSAPKGHKWIETDDGSKTLYSERFDENCHSTSGAVEETKTHYLKGCGIEELLLTHDDVYILEVGFGAGVGWFETMKAAKKIHHARLHFYSLEIDPELPLYLLPDSVIDNGILHWIDEDHSLKVILGDARLVLPQIKTQLPKFQAIYQDAFSPKKNPTLWTKEWFELLGSLCAPQAKLSTYSSSIPARKAMHEAGWGIFPGETFARKRSSTRAIWGESSSPEILEKLNNHAAPAFKDQDL